MALGRIKPYLIDATGASANQVLTYNVATGFVSFENSTGGDTIATIDSSNITFEIGNVLPAANAVYSLGGPDLYWKDLFVSEGTIILGNTSISVDESANVVFTNRITDQPAKIEVDEIVLGRGANKKRIKLDDTDNSKIRFGDARIDTTDNKDINSELGNVSANVDIVSANAKFNSSNFWGYYANETELTANYIHGAFAHVHGTGRAYYGHAGSWVKLANESEILADNNSWVNANDYSTYTTVTANTYDTYVTLTGLIDTVQDNVISSIGDLTDVDITTNAPADGQALVYVSANASFEPGTVASGSSTSVEVMNATVVSDTFTTSSSSNTFTLSQTVFDANNIIVSFEGINQVPTEDFTVSGTTLTLNNTNPISAGLTVEVRHFKLLTVQQSDSQIATANGVQTSFTSPYATSDPNDVIVTVDGLVQRPTTDYTISGTTVTFGTAPPNGTSVMVRHASITSNLVSAEGNKFTTITTDSGQALADATNDELTITGGTGISTSASGDTITITSTGVTTGKAIAMAMIFGG